MCNRIPERCGTGALLPTPGPLDEVCLLMGPLVTVWLSQACGELLAGVFATAALPQYANAFAFLKAWALASQLRSRVV